MVLKDGQLQSGGAMEERESPRPGLTDHCYATDFCLSKRLQKAALVDSCKSSSVLLVSPLVAFMF